jgi:hypothetical protein
MKYNAFTFFVALASIAGCVADAKETSENLMTDLQVVTSKRVFGRVVNTAGNSVENALLYSVCSPDIFAKTDGNGEYSLAGNMGDEIYVSAPECDDVKVDVALANGGDVTAPDIPAVAGVVYTNNFNSLRPGPHYSEAEARTDFNTYVVQGLAGGTDNLDNATIDNTIRRGSSGSALKILYLKGGSTPSESGIQISIPLSKNASVNNFQSNELYFSYWFRFSDDFDFRCGGKMPGLAGSTIGDSHGQKWTGRWMWRFGGSIQYYMHYASEPSSGQQETFLDWGPKIAGSSSTCHESELFTPYLTKGTWQYIELHYKLNTPGRSDGLLEGWFYDQNGNELTHYTRDKVGDFRITGKSENITLNSIFLSTFFGGSSGPEYQSSKNVYAWFDDFTVSSSRIGFKR